MIRRTVSVVLFFVGGWILTSEALLASFDLGGSGLGYVMLIIMLLLAVPFLLGGAWASPGERWRELGLTMMIAAGMGVLVALTLLLMYADPAMKPYLSPQSRELHFAPLQAIANLIFIGGLGWLQYRTGRHQSPREG